MATATDESGVVTLPGADALSLVCSLFATFDPRLVTPRTSGGEVTADWMAFPEHRSWQTTGFLTVFSIGYVWPDESDGGAP